MTFPEVMSSQTLWLHSTTIGSSKQPTEDLKIKLIDAHKVQETLKGQDNIRKTKTTSR